MIKNGASISKCFLTLQITVFWLPGDAENNNKIFSQKPLQDKALFIPTSETFESRFILSRKLKTREIIEGLQIDKRKHNLKCHKLTSYFAVAQLSRSSRLKSS